MKKTTALGLSLLMLLLFVSTAVADDLQVVKKKGKITMAMSGQYPNPRPLDADAIRKLLQDAFEGKRPQAFIG